MVPFYGTVYKSILYDLIIPFPACEAGAEREKDMRLFLRPGIPKKANNLIINSLWIVFYVEWHQLHFLIVNAGSDDFDLSNNVTFPHMLFLSLVKGKKKRHPQWTPRLFEIITGWIF